MLDQETKKRIDDCRNILVGKVPDPKSQVEQITIAMIYKFMYDMDLESMEMGGVSTYFVGEYEKYSWGNIFNPRIGGNEMIALYGEGIVKMNLNPNIPQLFRDIFKNAYLPYRDPETLKLFLKGINEFHYSHSEKLGDAFEYLLSVLGSQGDAGQFRTPRHIIDFVVELLQPKKNERILDPACGTSGFLISSYKHILRNNTKKNLGDLITPDERNKLVENISGYDISPDMVRLSLVNLYLHNFSNPKIYEYDSLTSEDRWNEYYDVILANPPFMSPKGGIKPHKRFSIQSNRAEVLFVDYIMEHLTPKGRSGIVVPEGIIFQSGTAYKSLRKSLVEKYLVGVISLPSGVFQPYSGVKTSILILDKELSQKTDKIFFGKVDNDGFDLGAQRREIEKNDLPILIKEVTEYLDGLRKGKIVESEKLTYVPKEQILSSGDIVLTYERYSVKKQSNTIFPIVKLGDICIIGDGNHSSKYPKSSEMREEGVPFIRATNLKNGKVIDNDILFISSEKHLELKKGHLRTGDVIFCNRGEIGKSAIVGKDFNNSNLNSQLAWIRPNDNILSRFLYNILQTEQIKSIVENTKQGATLQQFTIKQINNLEIPLPPIEVQEEIVRELEQYQKMIDGAKQVVDNYKPSIDIDPSWEMKELESLVTFSQGTQIDIELQYPTKSENQSRFIRIIDFTQGNQEPRYVETPNEKYLIKEEDISMVRYGASAGFVCSGLSGVLANNLFKIEPINNTLTKKYLFSILNSTLVQDIIYQNTNGVAMPALSFGLMKKISIPVPSPEIQQSIVERIESERQIIEGNKKLIEIYTQKIQDRINKIWGE
jgi:type I restriction enzyme M protein